MKVSTLAFIVAATVFTLLALAFLAIAVIATRGWILLLFAAIAAWSVVAKALVEYDWRHGALWDLLEGCRAKKQKNNP